MILKSKFIIGAFAVATICSTLVLTGFSKVDSNGKNTSSGNVEYELNIINPETAALIEASLNDASNSQEEQVTSKANLSNRLPVTVAERTMKKALEVSNSHDFVKNHGEEENNVLEKNTTITNASNSEDGIAEDSNSSIQGNSDLKSYFNNKLLVDAQKVEIALNVRQDANIESTVVGKIYPNGVAEILEESGEWVRIRSGNVEGYVHKDYVLEGEKALTQISEEKQKTVTVIADSLNIRLAPTTEADILDVTSAGEQFTCIEETNGWVAIQYSPDTKGYVSAQFVTVDYDFDTALTLEEIAQREKERLAREVQPVQEAVVEVASPQPVEEVNPLRSLGVFKITYYCHCSDCTGKNDGITATGTKVQEGRTIAVYPAQIPLGSEVVIDGNTYVAEDKGSGVGMNRIDIYVDSHEKALQLGVKYAEVFVKN